MADLGVIGGKYRLLETIGQGGMGVVYRGTDIQSNLPIAIKHLKGEAVAHHPDLIERFKREGEALRQLDHPNIVKILAMLEENNHHYLIMEYVSGGDLHALLLRGVLPIQRTLGMALDLADALTRAHRLQIIHRDLKPANVLIADDGTPRLTDFGVARITLQERVTGEGTSVGTPDYMPPEALNGEAVDARADIWALGVLLYEMLTAKHPFAGNSLGEVVMNILSKTPDDLETLRADCPVALADLIYRMLEKDRHARISSVRLVGAELEAMMQGTNSDMPSERAKHVALSDYRDGFATPTPPADAPRHNLPAQTTPFVGREHELTELARLLTTPDVRLVTILGPGGMGKTRLSLQAAEDYLIHVTDGVFLVSLAPLASADFIVSTIAEAVGFQFYQGGEPKQQLLDFFREKSLLLVMDNFEHLLEGANIISDILQTAPRVKILATSREKLGLSSETVFNLGGMDFPDWETPEDALEYSAVKLFMQGARRSQPSFGLTSHDLKFVARICRLTHGMPLGILLAAAWVDALSLEEIAGEIEKSLDFLETEMRDTPERHRSIRAVFDYSWNLLTEDERTIFAKLSVFRGGFTREAAQVVAGASLRQLTALMNKSLLKRNSDSGRYEVHELLRQYGEGKLREFLEGYQHTLDIHSAYYVEFMSQQVPKFKTVSVKFVLQAIETELDNVRAAWQQALNYKNVENISKAIECLGLFYERRGLFVEAITAWKTVIQELEGPKAVMSDEQARVIGEAYSLQSFYALIQWDYLQANDLIVKALTFLDEIHHPRERAFALIQAGILTTHLNSPEDGSALALHGLMLLRTTNDLWGVARALDLLGSDQGYGVGEHEKAIGFYLESIAIQKSFGNRNVILPSTLTGLGFSLTMQGKYDEGRPLILEGLAMIEEFGDIWGKIQALGHLSNLERNQGNYDEAKKYTEICLALCEKVGSRSSEAWCYVQLGDNLKEQGYYNEASDYYQKSYKLGQDINNTHTIATAKVNLGDVALIRGQYIEAKQYFLESLSEFESIGMVWGIVLSLDNLGYMACYERDYDKTYPYFRKALGLAMSTKLIPFATNIIAGIAFWCSKTDQPAHAVELLTMVQSHNATERHTHTRRIKSLLADLKTDLAADVFEAAVERGKMLDLDTVVKDLLNESTM